MEELGVEYDTLTVNLQDKSDEFKALYAKANPLPNARAKVPVLQVDDGLLTLCESIVVTEYLAESLGDGTQLQPASAADRARGRLFTELCSGAFSYFHILRARDDAEKTAAAVEELKFALVGVNDFLVDAAADSSDGGPFFFGEQFSTVECIAAPFVQRCLTVLPHFCGPELSPLALCDELKLPRLSSWIKAVVARPSVVATGVAQPDMIQSTTNMLERFAAAAAAPPPSS